MTIETLQREILRAIKINKNSIDLNQTVDNRTIELLKSDYDSLKSFINKCFKEFKQGE